MDIRWENHEKAGLLFPGEIHLWFVDRVETSGRLSVMAVSQTLLGRYLGIPGDRVQVDHDIFGKPFVRDANLSYSVSYTRDWMLVALGRQRRLGVDVESTGVTVNMEKIARRFFSEFERQQWSEQPEPRREAAFLYLWTRKEACLKARGCGFFDYRPEDFSVLQSCDTGLHITSFRVGTRLWGAATSEFPTPLIRAWKWTACDGNKVNDLRSSL